jgi:hypothetical protein
MFERIANVGMAVKGILSMGLHSLNAPGSNDPLTLRAYQRMRSLGAHTARAHAGP